MSQIAKNFSPKKPTCVGAPAGSAPQRGLEAARTRIVALLRARAEGEGGGDGSSPPAFVHWERHLAGRMGLALDTVRSLREQLEEGVDFARQRKGRIVYSEKGALRLRELARMPAATSGETARLSEQQEAPRPVPGVILRVVKRCPNAHVVLCVPPDKDPGDVGNLVRLWVKNNARWRPGMEAIGRRLQDDLYELVPGGEPRRGVR